MSRSSADSKCHKSLNSVLKKRVLLEGSAATLVCLDG